MHRSAIPVFVAGIALLSPLASRAADVEPLDAAARNAVLLDCMPYVNGLVDIDPTKKDALASVGLTAGADVSSDEITQLTAHLGAAVLTSRPSASGRVVVAAFQRVKLCRVAVFDTDSSATRDALTKEFGAAPWRSVKDEHSQGIHLQAYGWQVKPAAINFVEISGPDPLPKSNKGMAVLISVLELDQPQKPSTPEATK